MRDELAQLEARYQAMLGKLPAFDPAWSPEVKAAWWKSYAIMQAIAQKLDAQKEPNR